MDIRRKNKKMISKKHLLIIGVPLVVCATYAGVALGQSWWPFTIDRESDGGSVTSQSNNSTTQTTQQQSDAEAKKEFINEQLNPSSTQSTPVGYASLSAYQQSDDTVIVTTKLSGVSDGTCSLKATRAEKSTAQQADVLYQPEYSMCAGFSIPTKTLGPGVWRLDLEVGTLDGHHYTATGTVTVR